MGLLVAIHFFSKPWYEILKRKMPTVSDNIIELENIEKKLVAFKEEIEKNEHQRWKNAVKYKEPNNPALQTRINQILANGPLTRQQTVIEAANQEQIPNNSNHSNNSSNVM